MNQDLFTNLLDLGLKALVGVSDQDRVAKFLQPGRGVSSGRLQEISRKKECDTDDWGDAIQNMTTKQQIRLLQEARDIKLLYHFAFNIEPCNNQVKRMRHFIIKNPAFISDLRAALLHRIAPVDIRHKRWRRLAKRPKEYDAKLERNLRKSLKGVTDYQNPNLRQHPLR